jgi:hypothetical protein
MCASKGGEICLRHWVVRTQLTGHAGPGGAALLPGQIIFTTTIYCARVASAVQNLHPNQRCTSPQALVLHQRTVSHLSLRSFNNTRLLLSIIIVVVCLVRAFRACIQRAARTSGGCSPTSR